MTGLSDARGFVWHLEPARYCAQVELMQAQQELARCIGDEHSSRVALEGIEAERSQLLSALAQLDGAVFDPQRTLSMRYVLLRLNASAQDARERHLACQSQVTQAIKKLSSCNAKSEALDAIKGDALAEHLTELTRKSQTESDQDWLGRRLHTVASPAHKRPSLW